MSEFTFPNPIIFGRNAPKLRLRLESNRQFVYSISNHTLYLPESDLISDGTYSLSLLWDPPFFSMAPMFAENLHPPTCRSCQKSCPMLIAGAEELDLGKADSKKSQLTLWKLSLHAQPQLERCPLLSTLLDCCETPAEKKFARAYYNWAIADVEFQLAGGWRYKDLTERFGSFAQLWQKKQLQLDKFYRTPKSVAKAIVQSLRAPALIPQVWLNWAYRPDKSPGDDEMQIKDIPKRVDFLFIKKGELHIVEIDDPSHYARYDESKKRYEVEEQRYTNNLRAERALRKMGLDIHRLSNLEIISADESALIELIPDALDLPLYNPASPKIRGLDTSE